MFQTRTSTEQDTSRILEIWREAVDATHHFLSPEDREAIEREVSTFFPKVCFILAVDETDEPLGFMFLHEGHLEALFVDPTHHGKGIGNTLIKTALVDHPDLTTDVNEQNLQAVGFYERMGFVRTGRSATDGQGRPYPLIHLQFQHERTLNAYCSGKQVP
ncbi:putative N-acetyltransferase YjaB [Pseudovibrio axinellae]|uniref:Putative N-acetyltransferase YjaB n=1 Tax=Pseudovibrio axinellae TaxID=989403 RepID=A0A166A463_9HYPH|nr:acetyltransferase [Pseudovibrio axinellae]KZL20606.1 putative N-acetyltransferase YjaB [Pseudovibrio axinellae]SER28050.1 putative acetyltransferase [Pseudovibrio axinellae]